MTGRSAADYDLGVEAELRQAAVDFVGRQQDRCEELGIGTRPLGLSHLAIRVPTWREYCRVREAIEGFAAATVENVWNGRPIAKIVLRRPIDVDGRPIGLVELIPPFHQRVYRMGIEHVGFVVGDGFGAFVARHREVLTGQQFQSRWCAPVYRLFPDYTHVKFYERSLRAACELEGAKFAGFMHADWHPVDVDSGPYEL